MAIVVKDGSELYDNNTTFSNNKLDLVMFIKKIFYAPPKIFSENTFFKTNFFCLLGKGFTRI